MRRSNMGANVGVFEGLQRVFCAKEAGCYPMGFEVFSTILREGEEQ
jgi:hypothetical protein